MPTYEYACRSCGKHHDVVQSFGDEPLTECPACGGPLRKVFGSVGVVFKGSGFYKTDSRAATNGKKTDKDKADKDAGDKEKASTDGSAKDGGSTTSSDASPSTQGAPSSSSSSPSPSSPKPSKSDKTAGTSKAAAS
jgi:putative FmdB family regulatory protein